ncbi:MAG: hypothetical protein AB1578_08800 [Thermodesulfobacteriota bacterium]
MGREVANPLDEVTGSTLLGTPGFVEWAKEKFVKERGAHRDLPALRRLSDRPTIEAIRRAAQGALGAEDPWAARRLALYLCHHLSGQRLTEIGKAFGVGPSAVSQASRRVAAEMTSRGGMARAAETVQRVLGK